MNLRYDIYSAKTSKLLIFHFRLMYLSVYCIKYCSFIETKTYVTVLTGQLPLNNESNLGKILTCERSVKTGSQEVTRNRYDLQSSGVKQNLIQRRKILSRY